MGSAIVQKRIKFTWMKMHVEILALLGASLCMIVVVAILAVGHAFVANLVSSSCVVL